MSKTPYNPEKAEKAREDDENYEIVSFENFCDKSPGSKTDLLTLNDNINYRLCYESDKAAKLVSKDGESSKEAEDQTETSLNGSKNVTFKRNVSETFAPFGRGNNKPGKGSLFGGVIPKPRPEPETGAREHRYQRFSSRRNIFQRIWEHFPTVGSGVLGVALVCALCVGAWWAVCGAVGGAWREDQYRKLWQRAHPDNTNGPVSSVPYEKVLPEYRYHDHNNLSTKNKNATDLKKKDVKKPLQCKDVPTVQRFDCYPSTTNKLREMCAKRGCCFDDSIKDGSPYCFYSPQNEDVYRYVNSTQTRNGVRAYYTLIRPAGYLKEFAMAAIDFVFLSDDTLQIKIYDPKNKRWEPPLPEIPIVPKPLKKPMYRLELDGAPVGFKIIRTADNVTILDTQNAGMMILSDQFLQLSALLPSRQLVGFGEHQAPMLRDMKWRTFTMFNADTPPLENANLYGSHPFYMNIENNGKTHGTALINSNAIDVTLQPTPAVTYRAIGGILNLFVFLGPSPSDVAAQYTALVGRPFMPPYWALGFHLCRFGYDSVNKTEEVWRTNREAGIPFDAQWNDIDYMEGQNDFTLDKRRFGTLPQFVEKVHKAGMHYMLIIDIGVSASLPRASYPPLDRGLEMSVFIRNTSGDPFIGQTWNDPPGTVFPDFTHPNTSAYWAEMMADFHKIVPYDGAWLDMNEPSLFNHGNNYCPSGLLPYSPARLANGLNYKTLCMTAQHHIGKHYDVHNMHPLAQIIATNLALKEIRVKRPFIISRSTFPGAGRYGGHWSGDVSSTWDDMKMSVPKIINFNIFGIPMVGADICGFKDDTNVELCKRWFQLGAFYPFSRNHADRGSIPQDPVSLGPEVVDMARRMLRVRYSLLPYYYTLFWRAHTKGELVVRPVFFHAPENAILSDIDNQFLVGPYIMVTPILERGHKYSKAFFPGPQVWYNFITGEYIASNDHYPVTEDDIVSVRGGAIVPLQPCAPRGPVSTSSCRGRPLRLIVAADHRAAAAGELYWDDGDSLNSIQENKYSHIEFKLFHGIMTSKVNQWGYGIPSVNNITVLGLIRDVTGVYIDGVLCERPHCYYTYDNLIHILHITEINLNLQKPFNVTWTQNQNMASKLLYHFLKDRKYGG